jgi:competence ComEA-like helix-hairpin-helix protein
MLRLVALSQWRKPMSKLNINDATREELVEKAELRPELADAILEFRGKHGKITDVEALNELHGVGPVTLEQLRTTFSFSDKREKADTANGGNKVQEREKDTRETAVKTASVVSSNGGDKAQEREKDTRETAVKVAPVVSSNSGDKAQEREKAARETALKTAEVVSSATRAASRWPEARPRPAPRRSRPWLVAASRSRKRPAPWASYSTRRHASRPSLASCSWSCSTSRLGTICRSSPCSDGRSAGTR